MLHDMPQAQHTPAGPSPHDLSALLASLDNEVQTLGRFVEVLKREHDALRDNHTDALTDLAHEKTQLAERLATLGLQRSQLLGQQQPDGAQNGMAHWLALHAGSAPGQRLDTLWQDLLQMAAQARQLNASNGLLIDTRLAYNQQLLHALHAATEQATLYGPDGHTQATSSGRHFGSA